jgi:hypothetical protein
MGRRDSPSQRLPDLSSRVARLDHRPLRVRKPELIRGGEILRKSWHPNRYNGANPWQPYGIGLRVGSQGMGWDNDESHQVIRNRISIVKTHA